jgi:hypothetical protein
MCMESFDISFDVKTNWGTLSSGVRIVLRKLQAYVTAPDLQLVMGIQAKLHMLLILSLLQIFRWIGKIEFV